MQTQGAGHGLASPSREGADTHSVPESRQMMARQRGLTPSAVLGNPVRGRFKSLERCTISHFSHIGCCPRWADLEANQFSQPLSCGGRA